MTRARQMLGPSVRPLEWWELERRLGLRRARFRRRLRRVARVGGIFSLGAALVLLALVGLGPRFGKYQTLTVLSGSMRPTIREGSLLIVRPVAVGKLRVGDVITYHIPVEDRRVVSHRIVDILEHEEHLVVRTRGDANAVPDPWVARLDSGPAWRTAIAVPYLGYGINALRRSFARPLLLYLAPLLLLAVWLRQIWGREEQPKAGNKAVRPPPGAAAAVGALLTPAVRGPHGRRGAQPS